MKNFVIATVSTLALLGAAANAHEASSEMKAEGHHMHHHHGHHHHGHALAVYVNYPPVNVAAFSACPCEYYQGNKEHAYVWHEGYFWYPHGHAGMLEGYAPHHMHGSYWYPSRLHPHMVYVDKHDMMPHEIYPVEAGEHMHHHKGKMKHHGIHKGAKKHHAKKMHEDASGGSSPTEGKPAEMPAMKETPAPAEMPAEKAE